MNGNTQTLQEQRRHNKRLYVDTRLNEMEYLVDRLRYHRNNGCLDLSATRAQMLRTLAALRKVSLQLKKELKSQPY